MNPVAERSIFRVLKDEIRVLVRRFFHADVEQSDEIQLVESLKGVDLLQYLPSHLLDHHSFSVQNCAEDRTLDSVRPAEVFSGLLNFIE